MKKVVALVSTVVFLLSSLAVSAEEVPRNAAEAAQVEQLLEVDVLRGTERIVNLSPLLHTLWMLTQHRPT